MCICILLIGAGRILIKSIIIVCLLNLLAWKASWAHRTGENEKKDNDKIKKSVQTSSACGLECIILFIFALLFFDDIFGKHFCLGWSDRKCYNKRIAAVYKSTWFWSKRNVIKIFVCLISGLLWKQI